MAGVVDCISSGHDMTGQVRPIGLAQLHGWIQEKGKGGAESIEREARVVRSRRARKKLGLRPLPVK